MSASAATDGIRLVAFDFEGTVAVNKSANSSWEALAKAMGYVEERKKLVASYYNGEIDYAEWANSVFGLLVKRSLTKKRLTAIIEEDLVPVKGAEMLFGELKTRGIKTAIISGGIKNTFEIFSRKYRIKPDYLSMANELAFDRNGRMVSGTTSNLDFEGKVLVLGEICSKERIPLKSVAYVGNDMNDIHAFREVGLSIAINATAEELKKAAKVVIDKNDLSLVLNYI